MNIFSAFHNLILENGDFQLLHRWFLDLTELQENISLFLDTPGSIHPSLTHCAGLIFLRVDTWTEYKGYRNSFCKSNNSPWFTFNTWEILISLFREWEIRIPPKSHTKSNFIFIYLLCCGERNTFYCTATILRRCVLNHPHSHQYKSQPYIEVSWHDQMLSFYFSSCPFPNSSFSSINLIWMAWLVISGCQRI